MKLSESGSRRSSSSSTWSVVYLDAELTLREGLERPDMSPLVDGSDQGMRLADREHEQRLFIPGAIDAVAAGEVEEAIWDRMHFASHLRSERLGEFTIGTELHRSHSLAIVQVLILYHLVNARAAVVLGAESGRADRDLGALPEHEAVRL
jgi:phosphoribulokinase